MDDLAPHYRSLLDIAAAIRDRRISSVELTHHMLDRIATLDPALHAYATLTPQVALDQARRADAEIGHGHHRGPLHGVPVAVKDLVQVAGVATTAGMPLHAGRVATSDATVVRRLAEAGAVLLGTLRMTEGAYFDHHPAITPPVNPWGPDLWPGASSSGPGVAVAAGLAFAALGSDTGGSIRFPAAANRITGLKPTRGRVSRHGSVPAAESLDHIGPLTRTAADAGAVLHAIAGHDRHDPTSSTAPVPDYLAPPATRPGTTCDLAGVRIGIDPRHDRDVDAGTAAGLAAARTVLRAAGATVEQVAIPDTEQVRAAWAVICAAEAARTHAGTYPERARDYGPIAAFLDAGLATTPADLARARQTRTVFARRFDPLFEQVDLLLVPTQPRAGVTTADKDVLIADPDALADFVRYATPFDMTGHPTITLPTATAPGHPPASFQLVARHLDEHLLVHAGRAHQRRDDSCDDHPDL